MEISGVIFRPTLRFSGGFSDTHSLKSSFSGGSISAKERVWCGIRSVCSENRKSLWVLNSGFCDKGYGVYVGGGKKKKEIVKKEKEKKELKKKTKLVKGLWKSLSMYSEMGFLDTIDVDDSISTEEEGKAISKVLEILLIQLLQLKAEEKEIKRRQKEEKAKSKKAIFLENMKPPPTMDDIVESSSSPSSWSSREETSPMVTNTRVSSPIGEEKKVVEVLKDEDDTRCEGSSSSTTTSMSSVEMGMTCCSSSSCRGEKIEVCMGGKCKKNGAEGLMEELKKRVGNEGGNTDVVVGCKCMGKCRSSPNVRVVSKMSSETRNEGSSSNDKSKNSLYFGVGMDDLDAIVDNFMGGGDGIRNN